MVYCVYLEGEYVGSMYLDRDDVIAVEHAGFTLTRERV